jgi:hypothetical protein
MPVCKAASLLIPKEAGHNAAKLIVLFGTTSLSRSWPAEKATTRGDLFWLGGESWGFSTRLLWCRYHAQGSRFNRTLLKVDRDGRACL